MYNRVRLLLRQRDSIPNIKELQIAFVMIQKQRGKQVRIGVSKVDPTRGVYSDLLHHTVGYAFVFKCMGNAESV